MLLLLLLRFGKASKNPFSFTFQKEKFSISPQEGLCDGSFSNNFCKTSINSSEYLLNCFLLKFTSSFIIFNIKLFTPTSKKGT